MIYNIEDMKIDKDNNIKTPEDKLILIFIILIKTYMLFITMMKKMKKTLEHLTNTTLMI